MLYIVNVLFHRRHIIYCCINAVKAKVKVKVKSTCVHHRILWTNIIFIRDIDKKRRKTFLVIQFYMKGKGVGVFFFF